MDRANLAGSSMNIFDLESVSEAEEKRKKTHTQKSIQAQVKHNAEFVIEDGSSDTDTDTSNIEFRYIEDGDGLDSDSDLSQSESTITVNSRARLALNEFNAVSTKKAQAIDLNKHLESSEFGLDVPSKVRKNLRRNLENEEVTSPAPPAKKKKTEKSNIKTKTKDANAKTKRNANAHKNAMPPPLKPKANKKQTPSGYDGIEIESDSSTTAIVGSGKKGGSDSSNRMQGRTTEKNAKKSGLSNKDVHQWVNTDNIEVPLEQEKNCRRVEEESQGQGDRERDVANEGVAHEGNNIEIDDEDELTPHRNESSWRTNSKHSLSIHVLKHFDLLTANDDSGNGENLHLRYAKCKCCLNIGIDKSISYIQGNNSNLKTHLQKKHPQEYSDILVEYFSAKKSASGRTGGIGARVSGCSLTKDQIFDEIVRFFINEMIPLKKVESPHLKRLLLMCCGRKPFPDAEDGEMPPSNARTSTFKKRLFNHQSAANRVVKFHTTLVNDLKQTLKNVKYCSCTCDFWTKKHRKFLAVNVHYILDDMQTVETKLLCCKRMTGTIDNEKIARKLLEILDEYGIIEKVVAVTTDNGADFKAALKNYGDDYASYEKYVEEREDDGHLWMNDDDYEGNGSTAIEIDNDNSANFDMDIETMPVLMEPSDEIVPDLESDADFDIMGQQIRPTSPSSDSSETYVLHELHDIENLVAAQMNSRKSESELVNENEPKPNHFLPIRVSCAAHTLNLIGKTDSFEALADTGYAAQYFSVMRKLNIIWKTADGKSRKHHETVEKYLKRRIYKPHRIRWNRIYDAIKDLLSIDRVALQSVCFALKIQPLCDEDYEFLHEFIMIIRPIAEAITVLEGDKLMCGAYLPVLFGIRSRLKHIQSSENIVHCEALLIAVKNGFEKRFSKMINPFEPTSVPLYIAMISNPNYKMSFIPPDIMKTTVFNKLKNMFLTSAEEILAGKEREEEASRLINDKENAWEMHFQWERSLVKGTEKMDREYSILLKGMLLSPKRQKMSDKRFEQLIMLLINNF